MNPVVKEKPNVKDKKKIEYRVGKETFLGLIDHKEYLTRHFTVFMDKNK